MDSLRVNTEVVRRFGFGTATRTHVLTQGEQHRDDSDTMTTTTETRNDEGRVGERAWCATDHCSTNPFSLATQVKFPRAVDTSAARLRGACNEVYEFCVYRLTLRTDVTSRARPYTAAVADQIYSSSSQ